MPNGGHHHTIDMTCYICLTRLHIYSTYAIMQLCYVYLHISYMSELNVTYRDCRKSTGNKLGYWYT